MTETKHLIQAVDDEQDVLRLIKRILEAANYEVITAGDSNMALNLFEERNPDLVLLDIKLPGKSGMDILKEIKASKPDTAVIMATGVGDAKVAIEAMKIGAFDYIVKPFNVDELVLSVERALEKRKLVIENRNHERNLEKQLSALNNLFQSHLNLRYDTEESYSRLADRINKVANEIQDLAKYVELERSKAQVPPAERSKGTFDIPSK